jgi:hypothetical protein
MTKKITDKDESVKTADGEDTQVKKKSGEETKPPEEPDEEQEEDQFDSETGRPRMRW